MKINSVIKRFEKEGRELRASCDEMQKMYAAGLCEKPDIAIAKRLGMALGLEAAALILKEGVDDDNLRQRERYWRLKNEK